MSFDWLNTWLMAVFLLATRVGMLFLFTPFDAFGRLPGRIRVLLVFALSASLVSALDLSLTRLPSSIFEVLSWQMHELFLGFLLVMGVYAAFASFQLAGKLLDTQIGFGAASIFDPATHSNQPLMGTILSLFAMVLFFISDAYQVFLRGIVFSLEIIPLGNSVAPSLDLIIKQVSLMFGFGLMLAAPVVMMLLLLDVGIAVSARVMPQMNVYFLFLPLKIFVGLMMISLSLKFLLPEIMNIFFSIFKYWDQALTV